MCIRGAKTVKKINLTTKLNFKIICVVLLLMITVTVHNLWLSLQEENEKNALWLVSITDFLIQKNLKVLLVILPLTMVPFNQLSKKL